MIIDGQVEPFSADGHLLLELLVVHRQTHAQVDEHVRHRAVTGALPVPGVGYIAVLIGVVHVADDVQDRPLRQQRLVVVLKGVTPDPVVVVTDAGQRLAIEAPDGVAPS